MATTKKKGVHYIDNKEFHSAMIAWKELCKEAEEAGEEKPQVTNYIGECFLKIANGLSYRPNFINYTYRSEMVSDGIENCLQYIHNFDPEKSKNPFAYFTQIIYYAFVRRIQKEKKQLYIKYKTMDSQSTLNDNIDTSTYDQEQNYVFETMTQDQKANMYDFISNFEDAKKKKKVTKKSATSLELFMGV